MLRFAEAGQVGVKGRHGWALMTQVDLNLAQVLALLQQMGGVGVAQGVDMGVLGDAAGLEGQAKGPLQGGAAHRLGGRAGAQAAVTFGGKEQDRMAMGFPLLAQEPQRALGQRDVAVPVAFAGADMQEHALRIDIAHFQAQAFAQAQPAGVEGNEANPMIQGGHGGQDATHFGGREHDRQFELGIGANQLQFMRPGAVKGFFPEQLEGADGLGAGLAGDLFMGLEMDAILAQVFGRKQVGGFVVKLADLADAGVIGLLGARADGQQFEVVGEAV